MQFRIIALSLVASLVAADSVQDLIAQVPQCAVPCLNNAAKKVGCSATDNSCKCNKSTELASQAIVCVSSSCSTDELGKTTELTSEICLAVLKQAGGDAANSAVSSAGAAATSAISDALDLPSATAAATGSSTTPTTADAVRVGAGMGLVGVAAMAVMVL
ncbi:hypothetical protein MGN70_007222 [Eutypa lata]|uniref:Putative cfem domain-containing protein n=1 Tax=Eutypa lata (strain UCR-EL1) TaxID=1287681 RepID=M7TBJ2_EUTLA|nr:putative cfem domain-containing protein [Eutypa lata UCREL1]KAI1250170.1 hypothetical protein MGN70_007222 [Eutypa lata]